MFGMWPKLETDDISDISRDISVRRYNMKLGKTFIAGISLASVACSHIRVSRDQA